jgi:hypothetical protein
MREDRELAREPGPQPDPMLRTGRAKPVMIWAIALACVAIVVMVLIAIAPPLSNTAGVVNGPQSGQSGQSSGAASTTPRTALPASRDNSNAAPQPPVSRPLTEQRGSSTTGTGAPGR